MRKRVFILLAATICCVQSVCQTTSSTVTTKEIRDKAIDNMIDVLFDSKAQPIRDRLKSFENENGIKIQYRVEEASLDQLGGLSEHIFRLFQTLTSTVNVNVKTITAEFSALENNRLSDVLSYKTNATPDLRSCRLPQNETEKLDSLYTKFLRGSPLSAAEIGLVPESLDGLYTQAGDDYQTILARHPDCLGLFDQSAYQQHVINTRQARFGDWSEDVATLSLNLSSNYSQIGSSSSSSGSSSNQGNTGVDLHIPAGDLAGKYIIDLNNCFNACTRADLETRCRMLFGKTQKRLFFVSLDLDYYLPLDSLDKFRDAATQSFSATANEEVIVALYLKMQDKSSLQKPLGMLLVKQINTSCLSNAEINFARQNNGGDYLASAFYKFNNLYKNIPKPLVICYQVAKVNGLLSTAYFKKGDAIKGREQIYFHVFRLDKAFDDIKVLEEQRKNLISALGNANGYEHAQRLSKEIDLTNNKIKILYLQAALRPSFNEAETHVKEVYLQKREVAEAAALQYVRDKYGQLYSNNQFDELIEGVGLPQDLHQGSCASADRSDVIGTALNVSSLLLSPVGLDFVSDALAVAYFAATNQTLEMMLASASFLVPGNVSGLKKLVNSAADAFKEINAGNKLLLEAGQLTAIEQDVNYVTGIFGLNPQSVDAALVAKINNNPSITDLLLSANEAQAKVWTHAEKLDAPKRLEFVKKCYEDAEFRTKCLNDPQEVLRWGGVIGVGSLAIHADIQQSLATILSLKNSNKLTKSIGSASDLELGAIHKYTEDGGVILTSMRNGNETIIDAVNFNSFQSQLYQSIRSGLSKLRQTNRLVTSTVIRGRTYTLADYNALFNSGNINIPLKGMVSCTKNEAVAIDFLTKSGQNISGSKVKVIMKIKSKNGVDIDDFSDWGVNLVSQKHPGNLIQEEVLLDEGMFKIIGQPVLIKTENGIPWYEVTLEELGTPLRTIN